MKPANKALHLTALSRRTSAVPHALRLDVRRRYFPASARRVNRRPLAGMMNFEHNSSSSCRKNTGLRYHVAV